MTHKQKKTRSQTPQLKAKKLMESIGINPGNHTTEDIEQLVRELQSYQKDLEIQAEELREQQQELAESREKYFELYDLAPVGYVTMNKDCMIMESNLAFCYLVGIEKSGLKNQRFMSYVAPDYRDIFHTHCDEIVESGEGQSCELKLRGVDGNEFWVNIRSTAE
nr:PAS domain S-box protein [candidate division Zixibacteria bacterium]NIR65489.1 PAS domain S-box protein [candidate division Zixibacteria bacterium]NIS15463.1 PAS domain S-box protein [candidate division Zixibacteria bacterium]NIS47178.1 PAS domain S-box protein [candidate division Zixibacteria bacterium]NIT51976.1 PAS domain S-box protein [candidate division Zixibacteria bacterium]